MGIKNHTVFFPAQQVEFFSLIFKESLPVLPGLSQDVLRMKNTGKESVRKEGVHERKTK